MAVISEYEEAKTPPPSPSPCEANLDRDEPATPSPKKSGAPSPESLSLDSKPFRHDQTLSGLLKDHDEQPLELLATLIDFFFRKTDLSSDRGVQSKVAAVVAAIQKKNGCDGDDVAASTGSAAKVGEFNKISKTAEPCEHQDVVNISTSAVREKSRAERKPPENSPSKTAASNEAQPEDGTGLKPNPGNGFDHTKYSWTQTLGEVSLHVSLPKGTKGKEVACEIKNKTLKAGLKGQKPILEGEFYKLVTPDACFWTLEDDGTLSIFLTKCNRMEWWKSVVKGEAEIDTKKVDPEISKLQDLDNETRGTVEKMMYDQRQKKLGLPTSAESGKAEVLKKFMAQHPEMDFSNANIN